MINDRGLFYRLTGFSQRYESNPNSKFPLYEAQKYFGNEMYILYLGEVNWKYQVEDVLPHRRKLTGICSLKHL
jgi:hypothetical protein